MSVVVEPRLDELLGLHDRATWLRAQLVDAQKKLDEAAAELRRIEWSNNIAVPALKYYIAGALRKSKTIEKVYCDPMTTVERRKEIALRHAECRKDTTELTYTLEALEAEAASSRKRLNKARLSYHKMGREYQRALKKFSEGVLKSPSSAIDGVKIFLENIKTAIFRMDEDGVVSVYLKFARMLHGHVAILPNGTIEYFRPPGGRRGPHNVQLRRIELGCDIGV